MRHSKTLTVVAGLLWKEDTVLACQRRLDDRFGGKWEFPGGKVESGEEPAAALRRELEEELGVIAEIGELVWRTEHQYSGFPPVEILFFTITKFEGEPENRAFQQIRWMHPARLLQLDFLEADLPFVEKMARSAGGS